MSKPSSSRQSAIRASSSAFARPLRGMMASARRLEGKRSGPADDSAGLAQTVKTSADAGVTKQAAVVTIAVTIAVTIDELRNFMGLSPEHDTIRADCVF